MFSNIFEFEPVRRCPSCAQNFSNKIWTCRELNKEQISSLKLFKIRMEVELKIRESI
jgi:hypothetical protein